jgi:predicted transcriptional regulator
MLGEQSLVGVDGRSLCAVLSVEPGMSADLAGIRQETLSRIESGKHTATPATVDKIMRAIEAQRRRSKKAR